MRVGNINQSIKHRLLEMAKVVAPGAFGTSLQMSGGSKAKRKTPAELRVSFLLRFSTLQSLFISDSNVVLSHSHRENN